MVITISFLKDLCTHFYVNIVSVPLDKMPKAWAAGLYGSCMFSLLRNCQTTSRVVRTF